MKSIMVIAVLAVLGFGVFSLSQVTSPSPKDMNEKSTPQPEMATQVAKQVSYTDITTEQAKELISNTPSLVILDVSSRYAEGHLPGAINHYVGDGSLAKAIPSLDKDLTYLVYCHVDAASIQGAQMLIDAGFTKVYRLIGNYAAWVNAGYEVEK